VLSAALGLRAFAFAGTLYRAIVDARAPESPEHRAVAE
jgi:hypothetical protein